MNRFLALILASIAIFSQVHAERIKDIADIAGVRSNQLIGYGLVVGLDGTGDKKGVKFTEQSFRNLLTQLGINIPPDINLDSNNIAAVLVTAELPPFAKKGYKIDVNISSIGDSKSLRGGTLLMTPLKGVDGNVYALAQGNLVVGGLGAQGSDGSKITINVPSSGRIPGGATVEEVVPNTFHQSNQLIFNLKDPDFTTAKRLADAVNQAFGPDTAFPLDAMSVRILTPTDESQRVNYVSVVENIELVPADAVAKIIVNARTGTIVIGQHVKVSPAAVTHGSLTVTISENPTVSQPNPFSDGKTEVVPSSSVKVEEETNRAFVFDTGTSLHDIVSAINAVGAAPADLVAILEALKQAGALHADLIII